MEDLHGHGLSLRLVDPSVAKERSEWSKSRLLKPFYGILNRVRSAARFHLKRAFSNGRHQSSSSSMPRLILFNARPWKMPSPVARRPVKVVRLWIQLQSRSSLERRSREH